MATVHGDDITIGGQRTAVESLIKMIFFKKYEIGGDPDLEKSGENTQTASLKRIATASQLRQIRGNTER